MFSICLLKSFQIAKCIRYYRRQKTILSHELKKTGCYMSRGIIMEAFMVLQCFKTNKAYDVITFA